MTREPRGLTHPARSGGPRMGGSGGAWPRPRALLGPLLLRRPTFPSVTTVDGYTVIGGTCSMRD